MSHRPSYILALLLTATVLAGCGGDAHPIRTGNDYAVTTGGLGSMAGGTVGTAPEQHGMAPVQEQNWDQQPAPQHPGPDVMPPVETPTASVSNPNVSVYNAPPATDMPAAAATTMQTAPVMPQTAPAPTYANNMDQTPACDYAAMVGKPLTEESVTKLVRLGKIVRELTPGQPATMDFQPSRVSITTDPNTGKVTAVTCG